jgi:predicted nucleic acid-binding Zn ribbon protein
VSRRDKSLGHTQEESQPLRRNGSSSAMGMDSANTGSVKKRLSTDTDESSAKMHKSVSDKSLAAKLHGSGYFVTSSEDEDVCPTCLEGTSCITFIFRNPFVICQLQKVDTLLVLGIRSTTSVIIV